MSGDFYFENESIDLVTLARSARRIESDPTEPAGIGGVGGHFVKDLPYLKYPDEDSSWRDGALCRREGVSKYFDSKGRHIAIAVCNSCPSKDPCLAFAVNNKVRDGVWGGRYFGKFGQISKGVRK